MEDAVAEGNGSELAEMTPVEFRSSIDALMRWAMREVFIDVMEAEVVGFLGVGRYERKA